MTTSPEQISLGLALALLAFVPAPMPLTVNQLRRRARARGIRSIRRGDQRIPVYHARRDELLAALNGAEQCQPGPMTTTSFSRGRLMN